MSVELPTRIATLPAVRRARTTPGLLVTLTAALVALAVLFGVVGLLAVQQRAARVDQIRTVSGPLSVHALDVYRSLSDADATAAAAFLSKGVETPALRQRYLDDIARASSALALALRATDDATDPNNRSETLLRSLAVQLPVYTGVVETARAYNRQRLPLGGAYLQEASGLMRGTLLPAAQELFTLETDRLAAAQRSGADFPVLVFLLGLVLFGALIGVQVFVTRRTNRLVNPGLAVATLATVVSIVWVTVALGSATGHVDTGRRTGSALFADLAEARVLALQARADESLALIARGDGASDEDHYQVMMDQLLGEDRQSGVLREITDRARDTGDRDLVAGLTETARAWEAQHDGLRLLDDQGRHAEAVTLALSDNAESPSTGFAKLDADLGKAIEITGDRFARESGDAVGGLTSARIGLVLPILIVLVATVLGTRARIGEYR
ncbi:hypothetical protein [Cryptosporangium aurantiacum]|uniref:Four helix bundle sensory module for signal transduction n=1 Tax=Cryptosporangium aurantiacum TaxID=134849 RepID=A0A1M7RK85_9ACTN|nr:hypothetical protein [Cryptosporangium aurantiacum]SHN46674.1 hypothetical protein SAMN05443668_11757 [Cryptosporangium aurantiacum]